MAGRMQMRVTFQGMDDLRRKLGKVVDAATARKTLIEAFEKGARPIRDGAEQRAPRRTGELGRGITIREVQGRTFFPGDAPSVAVVADPFYGLFHEFGTVHQDAHPFMRPAFDAHKGEAIQAVRKELEAAIRKAAK